MKVKLMFRQASKMLLVLTLFVVPIAASAKDKLYDFSGNLHQLKDYTGKGKWTVVMIWGHDCHVCNDESPQYVAFHKKHKNKDAIVLGISLDGKKLQNKAKSFVKRNKINFDTLIGEYDEVAGIYEDLTGVEFSGTPTFMIYGPKGKLRAQQAGAVPAALIEQFMEKEPKS